MKIGIEIECVVRDTHNNPRVLPFIEYTKENPLNVGGILLHKDAAMLEMALPPVTSPADLHEVVQAGMAEAQRLIPQGWTLDASTPAVQYGQSELALDEYASIAGCSPVRNIYSNRERTASWGNHSWRTAGLHLNIETDARPIQIAAMDGRLLCTYLRMEPRTSSESFMDSLRMRQSFYGRPGEYRVKPFGLEYRALPNSAYDVLGADNIFRLTEQAMEDNARALAPMRGVFAGGYIFGYSGMNDHLNEAQRLLEA